MEERGRARVARPAPSRPPALARRDGVRPLQVHRLRPDRALDRQGLRRAVPPHHGPEVDLPEHRLGRGAPLVRAALLPAAAAPRSVMKVLVTGGAGFIGSHVVDRLSRAGHEPRVFDPRHLVGARRVDRAGVGRYARSRTRWPRSRGCEAVVHLAAVSDVNEVLADPVGHEPDERRGTRRVLGGARREGIDRMVYGSTSGSTATPTVTARSPRTKDSFYRCRGTCTRRRSSPVRCTSSS